MPTTEQEAKNIKQIADDFLPEDQAREFTRRLHEEVGVHTDNSSLAVSLRMFHMLYDPIIAKKIKFAKTALYTVITFHFVVLFFNVIAFFLLPFLTSWYIALPIMVLTVNFMFTPLPCPLTRLEDSIRRKLGMKPVKLFMGYYVVWPLKAKLKERRSKKNELG